MSHKITMTDGTVLTLPKPSLSFSQVSSYLKCPDQYRRSYVDGVKTPPGVALVEGSAAHAGVEENNLHKMKTGKDLPVKNVVEAASEYFLGHQGEIEDWSEGEDKADTDTVLRRAKGYLGAYMKGTAPAITPVAAEQEHKFDVQGIPFVAVVDLVHKADQNTRGVMDYKTVTTRSDVFKNPDKSLQLAIYAHLIETQQAGFIGFLKDTQKVRVVETIIPKHAWLAAEQQIIQVAKAISAGVFPMVDAKSWACNARFCGYYNSCRGAMLAGTWPKPYVPAPRSMPKIAVPTAHQGPPPRKAPPKRTLA